MKDLMSLILTNDNYFNSLIVASFYIPRNILGTYTLRNKFWCCSDWSQYVMTLIIIIIIIMIVVGVVDDDPVQEE